MSVYLSGLFIGLSLIVAIGPQNALVIRQGIKRQGILAVVLVCVLSEVVLNVLGTAGVGALVARAPLALSILKYLGIAYMAWFGYTCFRDAWSKSATAIETPTHTVVEQQPASATATVLTKTVPVTQQRTWVQPMLAALAFTFLNPAAYVDVVIMLGGIANQHGVDGRWIFSAGAVTAGLVWFPLLAFGAASFSRVLSRPQSWRIINFCIGVIMVIMCIRLALH